MSAGQLAAAYATIEPARSGPHSVHALFYNTNSVQETVSLQITPSGGVAATFFQFTLQAGEHAIVSNIVLGSGDLLTGQATDATQVNYLVVGAPNPTGDPPVIATYDANGQAKQVNSGVGGSQTIGARLTAALLAVGPAPTDTYAASMTIDVTKSLHVIAGVSTTSATFTLTPSAAGTAGDILTVITSATASGTVTGTFASTFHSSGTQATTASHFSSIVFQSDGTRWVEVSRTTNLA